MSRDLALWAAAKRQRRAEQEVQHLARELDALRRRLLTAANRVVVPFERPTA